MTRKKPAVYINCCDCGRRLLRKAVNQKRCPDCRRANDRMWHMEHKSEARARKKANIKADVVVDDGRIWSNTGPQPGGYTPIR